LHVEHPALKTSIFFLVVITLPLDTSVVNFLCIAVADSIVAPRRPRPRIPERSNN
jgi:hypothetical protein